MFGERTVLVERIEIVPKMKIFKVQPKTCYIPNKAEHAVTEEDGEIGL